MSNQTRTGSAWKPSDESVVHALLAHSKNSDRSYKDAMYEAIIAAVAADPMLSAAAELRDALEGLISSVGKRNPHTDEPGWGEVLAAILIAKTVIEKSRGEN